MSINQLKPSIFIYLALFLCFSCDNVPEINYKYSVDSESNYINRKIKFYDYKGNPRPKYFFSELKNKAFIYQTEPNLHPYILKSEVNGTEVNSLDSIKIPIEVFGENKGKLWDLFVVDVDHFVIVPFTNGYLDSTSIFELKPDSSLIKYTYFNYINRYYTNASMFNSSQQQVKYKDNVFCQLGYSYSGELGEFNQYGSPLFTKLGLKLNANESFAFYPPYLENIVEDNFRPISTMIDDKMIVNFQVENTFHIFDMNTGDYDVIAFNNPFLDEVLNKKTKDDPTQQMFESDFYSKIIYNPRIEKLILVQHEAENYYMDNKIDVKGFEQAENHVLVFDKELNLEGYAITDGQEFGFIQPSKNGFMNIKSGNYKGEFVIREFLLNKLEAIH